MYLLAAVDGCLAYRAREFLAPGVILAEAARRELTKVIIGGSEAGLLLARNKVLRTRGDLVEVVRTNPCHRVY